MRGQIEAITDKVIALLTSAGNLAQISEISRSLHVALFLEVMPRLNKWKNSFHAETRA